MKQTATQCFESECSKAKIYVENDMPIGNFHDFLMEIKGLMIDRMVAAHKDQQEVTAAQKQDPESQSCCDNKD